MTKRIFLAGASGTIGRRLIPLLVDEGWTVIGTTRSPEKASMLLNLGADPVIVDVFNDVLLNDTVRKTKPEIVVHQLTDLPPGLDPTKMKEALVRNARLRRIGTQNLVAAAVSAGAKRLVAQSLAFVYAPGQTPHSEDAPLNLDDPKFGETARAVASLEKQVLTAPLMGIILRYGKLYGPGTGFDLPPVGSPLHVDAAADAARRAISHGVEGIFNFAEEDGSVSIDKAKNMLRWTPRFRSDEHKR